MRKIIVLCLCSAMLAGCASNLPREEHSGPERAYLNYASDPIDRFTMIGGITGWESVSDNYLVLRTSRNKAYLVKTWICPSLEYAGTIRVVSATSNTVRRSDKIEIDGETCPIREIRQLDVLRMRADREAQKSEMQP